jgi:DNA-binding MarR family transcriptional regulator
MEVKMKTNVENHVGYLIQQISHLLEQLFNKNLANEDLSFSHARLIYLLYKNDGMTQSELQQDLLIKPSSITKLIDVLEKKGLVKREASNEDARIKRIYLTDEGKKKEEILCSIKENTEVNLLKTISESEHQDLIRILKSIKQTLQ